MNSFTYLTNTDRFLFRSEILQVSKVKFLNSEKAIKFCEISILLLSYVVPVKNKVEIFQNFVASEYMDFKKKS